MGHLKYFPLCEQLSLAVFELRKMSLFEQTADDWIKTVFSGEHGITSVINAYLLLLTRLCGEVLLCVYYFKHCVT